MNFYNAKPIDAILANTNITSATIDSSYMFKFSAVAKASHSSAAGSLQLQASDTPPNAAASYIWMNIGSSISISGTTAALVPLQDTGYLRMRLVYTDSSSGLSTATLTVEGFGFTF